MATTPGFVPLHRYTLVPLPGSTFPTGSAYRELTGNDGGALAWVCDLKADGALPSGGFALVDIDDGGRVLAQWARPQDVPDPITA